MQQLDKVAQRMNLPEEVVAELREPERSLTVRIPVRMDNGKVRTFTGFRVQHNTALGPTKGGTRLHPEEKYEDVLALGFWMTIKNALAGIPAGGAKGGIIVDPMTLSAGELERLMRAYVRAISPIMGVNKDIPGPDIGTPQTVMAWMLDEWEQIHGGHDGAVIAGKPPVIGGSLGREKATATGVSVVLGQALALKGEKVQGQRVVIQGFGNLGGHLAQILFDKGAVIVGISDVSGGYFKEDGLDIPSAHTYLKSHKTLEGWTGGKSISNAELLALHCDVLIPCAIQSQVRGDNVAEVKARLVVEGANGPCTPDAEAALYKRGVPVIPDIVANVGGAVVSYFEMVQDLYSFFWTEADVAKRLEEHMTQVFTEVHHLADKEGATYREAAWMLALNKVIAAMKLRGRI